MNEANLRELIERIRDGALNPEAAYEQLKNLPFEDIGFAKIDHHRSIRRGYPEAIFCEGKTADQIVGIVERMLDRDVNILATRASSAVFEAISKKISKAVYHELARIVVVNQSEVEKTDGVILVVAAGTADLPVAEEACVVAEAMGNTVERLYDVGVAGLHRLLAHREQLSQARVLIVVAGMEGALPSVVAGMTDVPVIAVPTSIGYGANFGGFAALLTMLNSCASGISVVNIDNGYGAAYSASLINHLAERKHG
ncbi:MAG: nickel pincer cofactor biosynthesis protein LarB [Spirochaetales bacterium]|nr:nickel pincer cofactor biosynthesis protein LarB [Spirochaetales bacterium]